MTKKPACPTVEVLLQVVLGDIDDADTCKHLESCETCQSQIRQYKRHIDELRTACNEGFLNELQGTTFLLPSEAKSVTPVLPDTIGKYRVIGKLSEGGQAKVYRVLHPELSFELVAKVSKHRPWENDRQRNAVKHDANILCELNHPNMARVLDFGYDGQHAYMIMEYVRGQTLTQANANRKLSWRDTANVIKYIARGLEPAHQRGIIHADLKPSNVVIDEHGQPRIIDFGVALIRDAWSDDPTDVTGGTPAYMSPEQASLDASKMTPASDVFSLGGIMFELLTQKRLYPGDNDSDVIERARKCDYDLEGLVDAQVPRGLRTICTKALAANPQRRFSDAGELAQQLERLSSRRKFLTKSAIGTAAIASLLLIGWVAAQFRLNTTGNGPNNTADARGQLRVGIWIDPSLRNLVRDLVEASSQNNVNFEITQNPTNADWRMVVEHHHFVRLLANDTGLDGAQILSQLKRIARVETLKRIASDHANAGRHGEQQLDIEIEVLKHPFNGERWSEDKQRNVPEFADGVLVKNGGEIKAGQGVSIRITNPGKISLSLTLFLIDSNYNMDCLVPRADEFAKIVQPGKSLLLDKRFRVTPSDGPHPFGVEHLIVIGLEPDGTNHFRGLINNNFADAQSIGQLRDGRSVYETPLGKLLKYGFYKEGSTRGLTEVEHTKHAIKTFSWKTIKE